MISFKDFGFKLLVVNELMYNQGVLTPIFSLREHFQQPGMRELDIEEEGYAPIPEAVAYFRNLDVPEALLATITELDQDGGDTIYHEIYPFWDGEGSEFDLCSAEDAALLPNLERVTLVLADEDVLDALNERGIEAEWL